MPTEGNIYYDPDYLFEISANFSQAGDPILYRFLGDQHWDGTPFQVATARHSTSQAFALVDDWISGMIDQGEY